MLRRDALEDYRNALLVWAPQAPWAKDGARPPSKPRILAILDEEGF